MVAVNNCEINCKINNTLTDYLVLIKPKLKYLVIIKIVSFFRDQKDILDAEKKNFKKVSVKLQ